MTPCPNCAKCRGVLERLSAKTDTLPPEMITQIIESIHEEFCIDPEPFPEPVACATLTPEVIRLVASPKVKWRWTKSEIHSAVQTANADAAFGSVGQGWQGLFFSALESMGDGA